ncbi:dnaJ homolog subfamily C member 5G [Suncus etruscus]|uniref:dnaJ homolog subfamily C member 5G n=1 Tax=Suncus etruscus TaxID=109475 RepID=UPI00210FE313|nr:dnaJ homolog subfamily C member 5G [Suncus etruscus]
MADVDEAARHLSKSGSTLYAVLELKKGASPEDVKKAYSLSPQNPLPPHALSSSPPTFGYCLDRRLALKYHPDKNPGNPQAAETFKEINTAHTILSDPKTRKIYDRHGSLGIYIYQHFGAQGVTYYFIMNSCWFKMLMCLCCLLTCCYCCCCCCFCCGTLRPPTDETTRRNYQVYTQQPPGAGYPGTSQLMQASQQTSSIWGLNLTPGLAESRSQPICERGAKASGSLVIVTAHGDSAPLP